MNKIKIILTSVVMVAALSFAYASSNHVKLFNYYYYPGGVVTGAPLPVTSTQNCQILNQTGCTELIAGESAPRQLFVSTEDGYVPVNKP